MIIENIISFSLVLRNKIFKICESIASVIKTFIPKEGILLGLTGVILSFIKWAAIVLLVDLFIFVVLEKLGFFKTKDDVAHEMEDLLVQQQKHVKSQDKLLANMYLTVEKLLLELRAKDEAIEIAIKAIENEQKKSKKREETLFNLERLVESLREEVKYKDELLYRNGDSDHTEY
uniref:Uncharacterized protein n=1 Tax=Pseudellipsoidion edaphicum TaxID=1431838 RepID=A0A410D2X4_9STRA|nr:hypothetical protein [Pseudellipsoidion edaphicum]QAA12052.1 hypothetical protein [Pseudellipsoidion edaphicum]